jgi:hypothetical protein
MRRGMTRFRAEDSAVYFPAGAKRRFFGAGTFSSSDSAAKLFAVGSSGCELDRTFCLRAVFFGSGLLKPSKYWTLSFASRWCILRLPVEDDVVSIGVLEDDSGSLLLAISVQRALCSLPALLLLLLAIFVTFLWFFLHFTVKLDAPDVFHRDMDRIFRLALVRMFVLLGIFIKNFNALRKKFFTTQREKRESFQTMKTSTLSSLGLICLAFPT